MCKSTSEPFWSFILFSGIVFHSLNENMIWAQILLQNEEGRDVKIWQEKKKTAKTKRRLTESAI